MFIIWNHAQVVFGILISAIIMASHMFIVWWGWEVQFNGYKFYTCINRLHRVAMMLCSWYHVMMMMMSMMSGRWGVLFLSLMCLWHCSDCDVNRASYLWESSGIPVQTDDRENVLKGLRWHSKTLQRSCISNTNTNYLFNLRWRTFIQHTVYLSYNSQHGLMPLN